MATWSHNYASASDRNIYAPWRPDITSTLDTETQEKVNNAKIGTTFYSTDAAGVGAYEWVYTVDGWKLSHSDTGILPYIIYDDGGAVCTTLRRINDKVIINIDNWSGYPFYLPDWFWHTEYLQFEAISDVGTRIRRNFTNTNNPAYSLYTYPVDDRYDLGRLVGNVEIVPYKYWDGTINPRHSFESDTTGVNEGMAAIWLQWTAEQSGAWTWPRGKVPLWMILNRKYPNGNPKINQRWAGMSVYIEFYTAQQYPTDITSFLNSSTSWCKK